MFTTTIYPLQNKDNQIFSHKLISVLRSSYIHQIPRITRLDFSSLQRHKKTHKRARRKRLIKKIEGVSNMQYFVKNLKIHKYPVPSSCKVEYDRQKCYDTETRGRGYEKCDDCFPEARTRA
jgi:hypothetical protein